MQGNVRRRARSASQMRHLKRLRLACQSVVESDVVIAIPPQEKIERRLTTDRTVAEVEVPVGYDAHPSEYPTGVYAWNLQIWMTRPMIGAAFKPPPPASRINPGQYFTAAAAPDI